MRHPFPNPSESQKWVSGKVLVCHILFFITKHTFILFTNSTVKHQYFLNRYQSRASLSNLSIDVPTTGVRIPGSEKYTIFQISHFDPSRTGLTTEQSMA